jgi:hypothetical protein
LNKKLHTKLQEESILYGASGQNKRHQPDFARRFDISFFLGERRTILCPDLA